MKLKMLSLILTLYVFTLNNALGLPKFQQTIKIANKSNATYTDKVVEIAWSKIDQSKVSIDTSQLIVIDVLTKKQVAFQFETKGTGQIQNLLVQVTVKANQTKNLILTFGKREVFTTKTYGRYVPERKDDFAWENDKIAFRMYGKALESTPKEMAFGIDVWVKRTDRMVLNERYKRGHYHDDLGDGMDYYHVGYTLGAGNMMPILGDSIYYSKNYVDYKVLDNGPLRTSFQLFYKEWKVGNKAVKAVKTVSLDAGSQMNKITVAYLSDTKEEMPVVAGIITRKDAGVKFLDELNGVMVYWEPEIEKDGITGVAIILANPIQKMIEEKGQILAKTRTNIDQTITYFAGAAWNKANVITNAGEWIQYVQKFHEALKKPLEVL